MDSIVPHVLHIGDSHHPWIVDPIERLQVVGHTPRGVRVQTRTLVGVVGRAGQHVINRPDQCVICLPHEEAWANVQAAHMAYQSALDQIVQALHDLGRYVDRLNASGEDAPNPLTPTIIHTYCPPDRSYTGHYAWDGNVPDLARYTIHRHTTKMVFFDSSPCAQTHCYLCPNDAAWERVQTYHHAAQQARTRWLQVLEALGTYGEARADRRYATLV